MYPFQNGQTALSIAQRLGYISVVETLKVVTEQEITTTTTTTIEEKYKVLAPESMQETFMSDSEDEGGKSSYDVWLHYSLSLLFLMFFHLYADYFFDVIRFMRSVIKTSSGYVNEHRIFLFYF